MKKFMLVPQHSLPSPLERKLGQLDEEMKTVLNRTDLSDFDKARVYSEILDKYLDVKRKVQQPQPIPIIEEKPSTVISGEQSTIDLNFFPQNYRNRARNLLTHAQNQAGIDWNQKGEVLVNGNLIHGSHVVDLIDNTIRYKKGTRSGTPGEYEFMNALKESNVPQALIGNKSMYNHEKQSFESPIPTSNSSLLFETSIPTHSGYHTPSSIGVGRLPTGRGYSQRTRARARTPQRGRGKLPQWKTW